MRRDPAVKRILSLSLAVLLSITTPLVTFAEELPEPVQAEAVQDNSSEGATNTGSESQPASGEGEQQTPADNQTGDSSQSVEPESPSSSTDSSVDGNDSQDENKQNKEDASSDGKPSDSKDDEKLESDSDQKLDEKDSKEGLDDEKEEEEEDEEEEEKEEEEEEDEDEEITLEFSDGEVVVKVTAARKVLGDAKSVKAKKIEKGTSSYEYIEDTLEEKAEEDGEELITFMAYDITLQDEDGNTVEPKGGKVNVKIDKVKAPDSEEELEDSSVNLIHFEQSKPVDMTDDSSTKLDTGNDASTVKVEFETDSFSPYVISWTNQVNYDYKDAIGMLRFEYNSSSRGQAANIFAVDEKGNLLKDITAKRGFPSHLHHGEGLEQMEGAQKIEGDIFGWFSKEMVNVGSEYTYRGAYINEGYTQQITNVRFYDDNEYSSAWQFQQYGSNDWNLRVNSDYTIRNNKQNSKAINIYLVYTTHENNNDRYFKGNLFNYDLNVMNQGAGRDNLIFHFGGDIPTENGTFLTPWNACDTVNDTAGVPTACPGIVQNALNSNGLPVFNKAATHNLFNPSDSVYRSGTGNEVFTDIEIPFYMEDGYYKFEARNKNRYDFIPNDKRIYRTSDTSSTGFWPFGAPLGENEKNSYSMHFGMSMDVDFNISKDGIADNGRDTVFEFAGDDDVWVFIDGKLVLDMGGVHQSVSGSINFRTGECTVTNSLSNGNRVPVTRNLYTGNNSIFNKSREEFAKGSHKLSFFYVERGGSQSNCKMMFNFKTTNENKPVDVEFTKTDDTGALLPGAKFGLFEYKEGGINIKEDKSVYDATSGDDGVVRFSNVASGKYILKETEAPVVEKDGKRIEYELLEKEFIVEVTEGHSEYEAGKLISEVPGSYKIYEASDSNKTEVKTIENKPKTYRKKITIIKKWEDNNNLSRRPGTLTFHIRGKYTGDDGQDYYVGPDEESIISNPVDYRVVEITAADGWSKTFEDFPVFFDNDTSKLITWAVFEDVPSGYILKEQPEAEIDEESSIVFETEVEPTIPPAANTGGEKGFDHIDIEYYGASDESTPNRRVVGIQDVDGVSNRITIIGYYQSYRDYYYNDSPWIQGQKNVASNASNGEGEWRATGIAVGPNTAVAFKVKFDDTDSYRLAVITNGDTYPSGTVLYKNRYASNDNSDAARYFRDGYNNLIRYYGLPSNTTKIDLAGKNIFKVAEIVCPATTSGGKNNLYANGNLYPGLDFVLSPNTIEQSIVEPKTGNETYTFVNQNKTVSLTFEKDVKYPGASNPRPDALYGFKVERIGKDGSVEAVIGKETTGAEITTTGVNPSTGEQLTDVGYVNGIFGLYAGQSVTISNLPYGTYRVTEVNAFYQGKELPLKSFETKVYYIDVNGEGKVVQTYTNDTDARAFDIDFTQAEYQHLKFENTFKQEFDWKLIKRNKNTHATLANAEFALKNPDTLGTIYYGISNDSGEVEWFNSQWDVDHRNDEDVNPVKVEDGTYLLKETKAPNGFALSNEEWLITVEINAGIRVTTADGKTVINPSNQSSVDGNVITYTYDFLDEVAYSLPETGGRGVFIYIIGGVLLMIGAALLLYKNKKQ